MPVILLSADNAATAGRMLAALSTMVKPVTLVLACNAAAAETVAPETARPNGLTILDRTTVSAA